MFAPSYFGNNYFAPYYFGVGGAATLPPWSDAACSHAIAAILRYTATPLVDLYEADPVVKRWRARFDGC